MKCGCGLMLTSNKSAQNENQIPAQNENQIPANISIEEYRNKLKEKIENSEKDVTNSLKDCIHFIPNKECAEESFIHRIYFDLLDELLNTISSNYKVVYSKSRTIKNMSRITHGLIKREHLERLFTNFYYHSYSIYWSHSQYEYVLHKTDELKRIINELAEIKKNSERVVEEELLSLKDGNQKIGKQVIGNQVIAKHVIDKHIKSKSTQNKGNIKKNNDDEKKKAVKSDSKHPPNPKYSIINLLEDFRNENSSGFTNYEDDFVRKDWIKIKNILPINNITNTYHNFIFDEILNLIVEQNFNGKLKIRQIRNLSKINTLKEPLFDYTIKFGSARLIKALYGEGYQKVKVSVIEGLLDFKRYKELDKFLNPGIFSFEPESFYHVLINCLKVNKPNELSQLSEPQRKFYNYILNYKKLNKNSYLAEYMYSLINISDN